jgi:hypothetical protein
MALSGRRVVVAMAAVAVVCLGAGFGLSRLIVSPGEAASRAAPPTAGPISVPVERRVLGNTVTLRGDIGYDDPSSVRVETGDLGGAAVVTGHVPEVGATLEAGAVALEITGRPVILLPGDLPTYRTLRAGVSGPDVVQLKQALRALGLDGGDPADDEYDAATAAGVQALYQKVGYDPPTVGADLLAAVSTARDGVTAAQQGLTAAQNALAQAQAGPYTQADKVGADGEVNVARAQLAAAQTCVPDPASPDPSAPCQPSQVDVVAAQAALDGAVARRAQMDAPPDTSAARAAVSEAKDALADARTALAEAQRATLTPLPASEAVFLSSLPRRVDQVSVQRGSTVTGEVMTVSGATIQLVASAARADADLLTVGATGTIDADDGELEVTVAEILDPATAAAQAPSGSSDTTTSDRWRVTFALPELTQDQVWNLQGRNVRIRIPVSSTQGEVLAVPIAALTAGPGGESRVEVLDGATSRLITVTTGLAADGFVEITSSAEPLEVGDLVVVGVEAAEAAEPAASGESSQEPTSDEGSGDSATTAPVG